MCVCYSNKNILGYISRGQKFKTEVLCATIGDRGNCCGSKYSLAWVALLKVLFPPSKVFLLLWCPCFCFSHRDTSYLDVGSIMEIRIIALTTMFFCQIRSPIEVIVVRGICLEGHHSTHHTSRQNYFKGEKYFFFLNKGTNMLIFLKAFSCPLFLDTAWAAVGAHVSRLLLSWRGWVVGIWSGDL